MEDSHVILNIAVALAVAFVGGVVARRLRLPVIVGYLIAGLAIGPSTPGFDADVESVRVLAELGVAFLMFSLGVEFSLQELLQVRRIALGAGSLQVVLTTLFGMAVASLLGWSWTQAIVFGMTVALSSSVVALKLLGLRGETATRHGRVTAGIAVFQDLSLVPMLIVLPVLANDSGNLLLGVLRSVGIAIVVIGLVIFLGLRIVPRLLEVIAETASRELFLLAVVVIALGTAITTQEAGLSIALGAFLAGMIVSESDFSHQVLADIIPLREAFATLFFVSVGMLLDLSYVSHHLGVVVLITIVVLVGKMLILTGVVRGFGLPLTSAVLVGVLLPQIGEVSFILAGEGFDRELLDRGGYNLILAVSVGTLLISPMLDAAAPSALRYGRRFSKSLFVELDTSLLEGAPPTRHTIVCGYGRLGVVLVDAMRRRGFSCVVVDNDPASVREAIKSGVPAIYGDAGNPEILSRLGISRARVLVVAISDPLAAEAAVESGRRANQRLDIVARARSREQMHRMRELGANEVIQPEFEAGLELIRHVMHVHGLDQRQVGAIVQRRREMYYTVEERDLRDREA
ncbi:MAG TPA: cation:proton antiporter [Thermomicrobiales bacterium]|nr:cation:proton antiporter [Thermomicrobiales bacterium]